MNFSVHMAKEEQRDSVALDMLWNISDQYRILLDYVLSSANIPHTYNLVSGKPLPPGKDYSARDDNSL